MSEVVRTGLRLLEEQEEKRRAALRRIEAAVEEGLNSGPTEAMEPVDRIIADSEAATGKP